ncbi:unnamed protein product [Clonostachys byssicola]|uniref:Protein kinase domain-containing protein n=1 Tax=Clonostachys byssicola TaxID=160290 RepID=A0A9N9Y4A1_9HYPO|nr:unnamed protein product [Clonostachys byssicola]
MDFTGLPEIVMDSRLDVRFADEGQRRYTIHPQAATRRSRYVEERWVHEKVLGQGGQGSVDLQVKDMGRPGTLQHRAVKKIRLQRGEARQTKMIQRELEAIFKFSQARYSELFVQSYGWFVSEGLIYIAMEYHELGDLQTFLNDPSQCPSNQLPEHDVHDISLQVLDALCLMHEQGFSHRDLKPANILIKHQPPNPWWVKLGDFGISKRGGEMSQLTTIGGTLSFMPPELCFHSTRLSTRPFAADMWSFGATIYRMFTSQPMFDGDALLDYWQGRASFPDEALRRLKVSNAAIQFITKLMAPESEKRISSEQALQHPWIDVPLPQQHQSESTPKDQTLPFRPRSMSNQNSITIVSSTYSNVWPDKRSTMATQWQQTTYSNLWPDSGSTTPTSYSGSARTPHQTSLLSIDPSTQIRPASQPSASNTSVHTAADPGVPGTHHHTLEKCRKLNGKAEEAFKDGNYQLAETIYRDAWKIKTRTFGNDHPETVDSKMKLAEAMAEQGNDQKLLMAESMFREVWQLRKATLGDGHRDTLLAEQNLASALSCLDRDDEAEGMFRGVLSAHKKALGDEHDDTLKTMNGLADLLLNGEENDDEERVEEAADLFEQVLVIRLKSLGDEHEETAFAMQKVSSAYLQQRLFADAEALSDCALHIIQRKYGKDHKKAFGIMEGLASALHMQGKADACEELLRELVEVKIRVLGEAQAVDVIDDLAVHLSREGKKDEAEQYYRKALRIQKDEEKIDQRTLTIMEALAMLLFKQGKEAEARRFSREVVDIRKKVDGIDHPATLHSMHILAKLMSDEMRATGGEPLLLLEEVVYRRQRTLGFEHEDTLQATVDLAHVYSNVKDHEKAESTYKEVIRVQRTELGAKHPHTLDTMNSLACFLARADSFLTRTDRLPAAETMLQDVIAGRQQALGESHPRTIESMETLREVLSEQRKFIDATIVAEKIVELKTDSLGKDHEGTLAATLALARIYTHREEFPVSAALYDLVIKTITNTFHAGEEILRLALLRLVELLYSQGKFEEAAGECENVFLHIENSEQNLTIDLDRFKTSLIDDLCEIGLSLLASQLYDRK